MDGFFQRFTAQPWGTNANLDPPTPAQALAGWAFLGSAPPTAGMFDTVFKLLDEKDAWLFRNVRLPIAHVGLTALEGSDDQLRRALSRWFGGGVRTISANTVLTADDAGVVLISGAAGHLTTQLPAANAAGGRPLRFDLARIDTSAFEVALQAPPGNTIEGLPDHRLRAGCRASFYSDGVSKWFVLVHSSGNLLGRRIFQTAGTHAYTPTAGTTLIDVMVIGGGGAGGGAGATGPGQVSAGAGGGGGGYALKRISAGFAGTVVTVGAGGVGVANQIGGAGGVSSFGPHCSATGGAGGSLGAPAVSPPIMPSGHGAGGSGVGGDIVALGGCGHWAIYSPAPTSGGGGHSYLGGGASPVSGTSGGNPAFSPGAGGSGGAAMANVGSGAMGGHGKPGIVVVWEFS